MTDLIDNPEDHLRAAETRGRIDFAIAVCELMDRADALKRSGDDHSAIRYLQAVASLDIDDKTISIAVDAARRALEDAGVRGEPSIENEFQNYLASLPPHDRHIMLARQIIRQMSSASLSDNPETLIRKIVDHFEQAMKYKPLGKRDERIYSAMKSRMRT